MINIEEITMDHIHEFWEIHNRYLIDDGIVTDEEDMEYFQSEEYRGVMEANMIRSHDRQHMVWFIIDGERKGAASYCMYENEGNKCFIMDFLVFPQFRNQGNGHRCYEALEEYTKADGALCWELNSTKENSVRFWKSLGFQENGTDEYDMPLYIKNKAGKEE